MDDIFNCSKDKIRVIQLPSEERKLVHQYIERYYPKIYKSSLCCKYFPTNRIHTFIKCYKCNYRNVVIDDYHEGRMKNNMDENRSGTCPKCDKYIVFEPNWDSWDNVRIQWENNIISFGYYFKGYIQGAHTEDVSLNDMIFKIYELDAPKEILDKEALSKYISSQLSEGLYTII